jgi:hypothetical protein
MIVESVKAGTPPQCNINAEGCGRCKDYVN